jgi:adenine deaminase
MIVKGQLIDIHKQKIYKADISLRKGRIKRINQSESAERSFIIPGLIDAHVHIESSMLTPGSFAMACVPHGTIGVVSDPHEIANVLGIKGVEYMIEDSKRVPVKFWFGAPSCVPATQYETSGGKIDVNDISRLLSRKEVKYLAEMMNYPGVIYENEDVLLKIEEAKKAGKVIDGHAPGLTGTELKKYVEAGISTDHECSTLEEAKEKINLGMRILIREGSAARNIDALKDLYKTDPDKIMLCSDDLHPEMLEKRHINKLMARLIKEGYDLFDVIRSATINPAQHYGLDAGMLRVGDRADFIVIDSIEEMNVLETWIKGEKVYDRGKVLFKYRPGGSINMFNCSDINTDDLIIKNKGHKFRIIRAFDGELLTKEEINEKVDSTLIEPVPEKDILKIVVKDRYNDAPPAIGFIRGFGIKEGAFASSVAHDSHNIIAIGTNNIDIVSAVNEIVRIKGGLAVSSGNKTTSLTLDIAGIMSAKTCMEVASSYKILSDRVKSMGCKMSAPFMSLSFMALLVIPELKISDKGLFDGKQFRPVQLFLD